MGDHDDVLYNPRKIQLRDLTPAFNNPTDPDQITRSTKRFVS